MNTDVFAGATPLGSSGYQSQVVANTAKTAKPYYLRALRDADQASSNRGLLSSGAGRQAGAQVGRNYQDQIGQASYGASLDASRLQEDNRKREEERGWALADQASERAWKLEMMKRQQEAEGNQQWSNLLGGAAGALGGAVGGPVGMLAGKGLYNWLSGSGAPPGDENGIPYPDPGVAAPGTY